jgi:SAM-dependent methyltransferase
MNEKYLDIVKHYENCLQKFGDNHLGVDWPRQEDVGKRYSVMLDLIRLKESSTMPRTLLDFGCGTAHLFEHMKHENFDHISYSGLDISSKFIDVAKRKFPEVTFYVGDVLDESFNFPQFDYIVMNGVFTEKRQLSFDEMWNYFEQTFTKVFARCNRGVAFNVMSKNVDWERDDLFHVPFDTLAEFLTKNISRHFVFRSDYGLYEYSCYVYK